MAVTKWVTLVFNASRPGPGTPGLLGKHGQALDTADSSVIPALIQPSVPVGFFLSIISLSTPSQRPGIGLGIQSRHFFFSLDEIYLITCRSLLPWMMHCACSLAKQVFNSGQKLFFASRE